LLKNTLVALKGLLQTCWRLRLIDHEAFGRAVDWPKTSHVPTPAGRMLSDDELKTISTYARAQHGAYGAWLRGVFSLLSGNGVRVTELCTALFAAYDPKGMTLTVVGKGNRPAVIHLAAQRVEALDAWCYFRSSRQPYLFHHVARSRGPRSRPKAEPMRPLVRQDIHWTCRMVAAETGLPLFSPHDFRRTFCTSTLDKGVDLLTTQRLMRHSSVSTTQIYDRREAQKDAETLRSLTFAFDEDHESTGSDAGERVSESSARARNDA
jgi:integrase